MTPCYVLSSHDIGYLHVLDFALHSVVRELVTGFTPAIATWSGHPARDADAEDFQSGDRHQ